MLFMDLCNINLIWIKILNMYEELEFDMNEM